MSKKSSAPTTAAPSHVLPLAPVLLIALGAAMSLLALFQWMELLVVRAGGSTVCGVNDVVNCQKVWDTGFAAHVHSALGLPVAGLGLVWGLAALALSIAWTHQLLAGRPGTAQATAIKLTAVAGVLSIPVFGWVSFNANAVCLTCITTYALVLAFALCAWRLMPAPFFPAHSGEWKGGLLWSALAAVAAYLVLLGPGRATPHAGESGASLLSRVQKSGASIPPPAQTAEIVPGSTSPQPQTRPLTTAEREVVGFLQQLPGPEKQAMSNWIASYRQSLSEKAVTDFPAPRALMGERGAPVKLVEWVDIRCPHCKALNEAVHELMRVAPEGLVSVEARSFPLASECNPNVQRADPSNVSCTAAKALVCLEDTKDFWKLRDALFDAQQSLTSADQVLEIASKGSTSRAKLQSCIASQSTQEKLAEDVSYAMRFNPDGTPVLTLNGRPITPYPPLVYALVMTQGDANSPVFSVLPSPDLTQVGAE